MGGDGLSDRARELRRDMTDAERRLWRHLRERQRLGCKFRRQVPVGDYIVDFACFEMKLVIEVDGSQHMDREERDAKRTRWLESEGFRVLRFWNNEVLEQIDGVLSVIEEALE